MSSKSKTAKPPQWEDKFIIGLTGNIATGKSAVMKFVAQKGALTLDADKIVHHILDTDSSMQAALAVAFGSSVRRNDGSIDRPQLASIVFSDPSALQDLELMLHPAVRVELIERINESSANVIIIEAIKLLEGTLREMCDTVWVTNCSRVRQIERLIICRGLDDQSAVLRVDAQSPQEEKVAQANVVIETDSSLAETQAQVEEAWEQAMVQTAGIPVVIPIDVPIPPKAKRKPPAKKEKLKKATPATKPAPKKKQDDVDISDVIVRRAKPSDLPAVLLLIRRATDNKIKMKRTDMLMAMSERSYFIGQRGTEILAVMGYAVDSGLAHIEQMYVYPPENAGTVGKALLTELEKSAKPTFLRRVVCLST